MVASALSRRLWKWIRDNQHILKYAFKNALAPTFGIWIIQSARLNHSFDTVGFLPPVISLIQPPAHPRIPYLRLFAITCILTSVALGLSLLAAWCALKARLHTTPPGGDLYAYNSSASAVSGVWLFAIVWFFQTWRTIHPSIMRPIVFATMYAMIIVVYAPVMGSMQEIVVFCAQMYEMFLLGYAFSTGVSLLIFPETSQDVAIADIKKVLRLSRQVTSLGRPFGDTASFDSPTGASDATNIQIVSLTQAYVKFQIDASEAKRDVGWNYLSAEDLKQLVQRFPPFLVPVRGLFAAESIRSALKHASLSPTTGKASVHGFAISEKGQLRWDTIFDELQGPMENLGRITADGIEHCRRSLKIDRAKWWTSLLYGNKPHHVEEDSASESGVQTLPGGADFVESLAKQVIHAKNELQATVTELIEDEATARVRPEVSNDSLDDHEALNGFQGRLLYMLYIQHLYVGILDSLNDLVNWCERKRGNLHHAVRFPMKRKFWKIFHAGSDSIRADGEFGEMPADIGPQVPRRERTLSSQKYNTNPVWKVQWLKGLSQKAHVGLTVCSDFLASPQSFFGVKVACAVLSVTILGLVRQTQQFFYNQRVIWALIFIPYCMGTTRGESKHMAVLRFGGSVTAIPVALINWYIVDEHPAGIVVFYFICCFITQYFLLKNPYYGQFWRPVTFTHAIIVGYALQTRYTDQPMPPATNTEHYPIYKIGPYRCLCILTGVTVAYIWTVFPKPTSNGAYIRRRLGEAIFTLTEYHSAMHWAVGSWAAGQQGNVKDKKSVAGQLMKARQKLFLRETEILSIVREQHSFAVWDSPWGGTYPGHAYTAIANEIDNIMSYFNNVIYVAASYHFYGEDNSKLSGEEKSPWVEGVADVLGAFQTTSKQLASLIHILGSCMPNEMPLPPFLQVPEPFAIARRMKKVRPDLMDTKHIHEEGYQSIAMIEVSIALTTQSLARILEVVKELNGELGMTMVNGKLKKSV